MRCRMKLHIFKIGFMIILQFFEAGAVPKCAKSCRAWKMLQSGSAKFGFDTSKNEPSKIWQNFNFVKLFAKICQPPLGIRETIAEAHRSLNRCISSAFDVFAMLVAQCWVVQPKGCVQWQPVMAIDYIFLIRRDVWSCNIPDSLECTEYVGYYDSNQFRWTSHWL